ncbi:MAG TPA: translation initiation factor IF-2 [Phycisphaerales bacterium]|nr:translation initiation factor IF-2 [Phycisphaerales bacterium]
MATAATSKIKIFQVAKELGVDSKVIVAKLVAESIPGAEVMNYQSTIPVGLAVTIKEWFSTDASIPHTAVETGEKVDIEKAKATKRPSRAKPKTKKEEDAEAADAAAAAASPVEVKPAPETPKPVAKASPKPIPTPQPEGEPPAKAKAIAPSPTPAPVAPTAPPAARPPASVDHRHAAQAPLAPSERPHADRSHTATPPHRPGEGGPPPSRPASAPPSRPAQPPPTRSVTPAPMNVPTRPNVVTPAGPRLQVVTPVKLSGPKVVRVEAPEQVEAPRPRGPRGPSSGPGGPRMGGGAGGSDDDRGRSPRRKETPGSAAAKRSSGLGVPERRRGRSDTEWTGSTQGIFSEQDLIEREARLARAGGLGLKKRKQELARAGQSGAAQAEADGRVRIAAPFTIKELSAATGVKGADIVKKLFLQGVMATINSAIDPLKAVDLMMDFDIELDVTEARTAEETVSDTFVNREAKDLRPRGPVVTILGHVDHGKTSLLDKIRNANVAAGEAGGITQKTSAFVSEIDADGQKKQVVFLDTPGHEAFTGMRARGAKITDVVVLVVSAPEGVMPQTIESINHAKAAKVPIVVALNKIDRPDATDQQIQKTLGQLAAADLNVVEWGGSVECVKVSALTGKGIPELLQILDLQASVLELKADFGGAAQGTVIEANMEEGRGAVANILVQQGKLSVGDFIVMGRAFGRVRDMTDDKGRRIKVAYPPMPVQISGIDMVCDAGDKFYVTDSLKKAEEAADQRRQRERHAALAAPKLTLDSLFSQMQQTQGQEPETKEIKIVLKTDQQGTVDVLKMECEKIKTAEVKVRVLHAAVGGITEADVGLADASKAIVIGFNVIPSGKARQMAEQKGIEIRTYQVIYDITDDLRKAAEGLLAPEVREEVLGHADVRAVFKVSKVGSVAGCYVTDGTVLRDALIRVTRNGVVIEHDRKLAQLKRVKDDAKEVRAGLECGMKIDGYDDIKEGDVLECYKKIEVKRTL